ncbi:DUF5682 family protein [Phytohabitans aurantiacus]|uniref:Uncharacterized protein n=1 Tax=Phytohabitans aurantiacus TaxID=3016789 RepID=A0ABQ5R7Y5_9ACTN|nr:DUF5682 family protein [Phytohabitans aurantiacus]GLI02879.1 hypothetical protein Pa4123_81570 [Phytohabitans aurantiacus]
MPERFYGIRHHGPGSARAVVAALDEQRPDILLVEGPPEADTLVKWVADERLVPPVALLGYVADDPRQAAYWPFAVFSPEWQAIRWAADHGVPVRFFDLPYAYRLAVEDEPADRPERPADPIGELAAAAGYDDPERWWEDVVEHRGAPAFEAIGEAMAAIRAESAEDPADLVREAHMRGVLREVRKTHANPAVVCGAWHVPALTAKVTAAHDTALLKGRKKAKVTFTWVPWTYGRLASWQGYGAGVRSPGWYHHLFTTPDEVVTRWLVAAAGVLREEGVPTSSAHVIEAIRLAEALATLRGRPLAGLAELTEATRSVLCEGDELRVDLIGRQLVVSERLGSIPDDMPAVPLARDLAAQQRTLRLKPEALERALDLDLRRDLDLGRSRLLHRLRLLGVAWGEPADRAGGKGTFRESWRLRWVPEFAISLVEAGGYGTTVVTAATAKVAEQARAAESLAEVTPLVEACLLADLPDAYPAVLHALDTRAALDADVAHLMGAVPPLARTLRYGDVRGSDVAGLRTVTSGLVARICAGLPGAVTSLADEAAQPLRNHVDAVHAALAMLDDEPGAVAAQEPAQAERAPRSLRDRWLEALDGLAGSDRTHPLIAGRVTRLLYDGDRLDAAETRRRMGLVLTAGTPPSDAAQWVEGFLAGGGLLLVHDTALLSLVDEWLAGVAADSFTDVLPLLRRTFGTFAEPERRSIGERVRGGAVAASPAPIGLDHERAASVLPTLGILLGREIHHVSE